MNTERETGRERGKKFSILHSPSSILLSPLPGIKIDCIPYMQGPTTDRLQIACKLMDEFAERTGLSDDGGNPADRYLWTDAFALQTYFSLFHATANDHYYKLALKLIDKVHYHLGRFQPGDPRKGWISGMDEEEGKKHPTAGGLRIGKKLPERRISEPFIESLEWERDGQYFHYITRWINALLDAEKETRKQYHGLWAAELLAATRKFMYGTGNSIRMYWKMNTDLSRPLITSMGLHDPLEGLICTLSIIEKFPEKTAEFKQQLNEFTACCKLPGWTTDDPLGIGGLLLNISRIVQLESANLGVENFINIEKILADTFYGLKSYTQMYDPDEPALHRLAFRECGLSLGLRKIALIRKESQGSLLKFDQFEEFVYLAEEIESFWILPENQHAKTWTGHLNINAVSLAASLVVPKN